MLPLTSLSLWETCFIYHLTDLEEGKHPTPAPLASQMEERKSPSQVHHGLKWGKRKYLTEAHKKANSIKWWDIIIKMAPPPHQSTSIMLWYKESKPVNRKGNQSWMFTGRTVAEAEAPILWPPDGKSWLIRKDPDAGKDWRQKGKGVTEDEMLR